MRRDSGKGVLMSSFFVLVYAFLAMFILSSLGRNRREGRADAPILALAGHGMMAGSVVGAALALGMATWTTLTP